MSRPGVLIADDDPVLRQRLGRLGRQCGFDVRTAVDGVDALAKVRRQAPDIVVTDVHMPNMGARQLIPLLRERPEMSDRPIIVVTADASRQTKIELLTAGADDFITKPVDPDDFQARLRAQARRSELAFTLTVVRGERDAALQRLEARSRELERLTIGLVAALERANSYNDSDTGNHIRRVSEYAALLARLRGCEEIFVEGVGAYAGLHDVGKVGIRDAILKKPGKLTVEEFDEMKTHTVIGAELLRSAGLPPLACNIPLCHHERWDGTGYPRGLVAEGIPLEARIVAVVDVFDALRSKRCYKPAFSYDKACSILREMSGAHLDPHLVGLFLAAEADIHRIAARHPDERPVAAEEVWG